MPHGDPRHPFRHEALLYAGEDDFTDRVAAFVRDGAAAAEPTLVMVPASKFARLRRALGPDASAVTFADMTAAGRNPARIIPAWRDFVAAHPARPLRGVGEPLYAGRSAAERSECHLHEALLNPAMATAPIWLLCPYDISVLSAADIEIATRNHPYVTEGGVPRRNRTFESRGAGPSELPRAPQPTRGGHRTFDVRRLHDVRHFVDTHARAFGLDDERRQDYVLAISEVATNSVMHGGGVGSIRCWIDDEQLVCEIADGGVIDEPLVGRIRPVAGQTGGYGLWLANQLVDLVQIRSRPDGTVVRLHVGR